MREFFTVIGFLVCFYVVVTTCSDYKLVKTKSKSNSEILPTIQSFNDSATKPINETVKTVEEKTCRDILEGNNYQSSLGSMGRMMMYIMGDTVALHIYNTENEEISEPIYFRDVTYTKNHFSYRGEEGNIIKFKVSYEGTKLTNVDSGDVFYLMNLD